LETGPSDKAVRRIRTKPARISTALLDSDNRCSFYASTQGELRVTHRFIADTALLDSDDRCFFDATARGEQRWYAAK
jgi:hypothetical protein